MILTLAAVYGCGQSAPPAGAEIADPVALGERKARACVGCHGPKGVSRVASYPSLAGKDKAYLAEQLRRFKSGERQNPMMNAMAVNVSETDIEHLAAYYAAQTSPEAEHD
ncbi:c-type cytochrome [Gilvimarinus xylanilyticus]|uniref:Cytochrome c n=1 Tax=Gilvimarinus xylanilyticus TaxID=2944139 RepID=A0A9X2HXC4_9GAMM|nr:cytochrome c [Gilvimarinus xylanilyticus]MCP8898764.1 cytochrome c [Gilvimarinus xylanilyticus]